MDRGREYGPRPAGKGRARSPARLPCPVFGCNRKYRSDGAVRKHVTRDHYYNTRTMHAGTFTPEEKLHLLNLVERYIEAMERIYNEAELSEDWEDPLASELFLEHVPPTHKQAHLRFIRRILPRVGGIDWKRGVDNYERFVRMGLPWYDRNFCPTLLIDLFWHAALTDNRFFQSTCAKLSGYCIPHCKPGRSAEEDAARHEYFVDVYTHIYHEPPLAFGPVVSDWRTALRAEIARLEKIQADRAEEARLAKQKNEARITAEQRANAEKQAREKAEREEIFTRLRIPANARKRIWSVYGARLVNEHHWRCGLFGEELMRSYWEHERRNRPASTC